MPDEAEDAVVLRRFGLEPDPVIEAYKRDVDRTLLRQNLMRTPAERWEMLARAARLAAEVRRAGASRRSPPENRSLDIAKPNAKPTFCSPCGV